jgi:FecR-like protein
MRRCSQLSGAAHPLRVVAALLLCSSAVWAQGTVAARVMEMEGRVSILKDNAEIPLYTGSSVEAKQLIQTGPDGYAKLQLSDGSTFEVFQNSQVVFRPNPFSFTDLLDVVIGRVKVFIEHRNGPNPNRVTTQTAVISVRGTIFDVVVEDQDATTLVSVDEGVVGVRHLLLPGNEVQLQSGESLRVFRNQPLARRVDKGGAVQKALRIAAQAVYDVMLTRPGATGGSAPAPGGGTSSSGGSASGDKNGKPPAGAPPPPPPPSSDGKPSGGAPPPPH